MREERIFKLIDDVQKLANQSNHNTAILSKQWSEMAARLFAIETVLMDGRFSLLKAVVQSIFSPMKLQRRLNAEQRRNLMDMDFYSQQMEKKQAEKAKVTLIKPNAGLVAVA